MGRRGRATYRCDLLGLAFSPVTLAPRSPGSLADVLGDDKYAAPLRHAIQRRTPDDWLARARAALVSQGLDAGAALALLDEVVNRPTAAAERSLALGHRLIRQATIAIIEGQAILAEMDAVVRSGTPPTVGDVNVEIWQIDLEEAAEPSKDLLEVAVRLEAMRTEFSVRETAEYPDGLREVLVLGAPTAGYLDLPPDWEARLRTTAAIFGLRLVVAESPAEALSQNLLARADLTVLVTGRNGWQPLLDQLEAQDRPTERLGTPGQPFAELHGDFRRYLLNVVWQTAVPSPDEAPILKPGQVVYHRKVAGSVKFDHFDAGSSQPCMHGAGSFVPNSGPKAIKGMERRYANFEPRMLRHCSKYPNCGMYAVDCSP